MKIHVLVPGRHTQLQIFLQINIQLLSNAHSHICININVIIKVHNAPMVIGTLCVNVCVAIETMFNFEGNTDTDENINVNACCIIIMLIALTS